MDDHGHPYRRHGTPSLIEYFADWLNLPVWFAGGLLGFVVTCIVLVVLIVKFKGRGLIVTGFVVTMSVINWAIFAWPFWAVLVIAIGFVWGMMR